jgi:hypothetical protein
MNQKDEKKWIILSTLVGVIFLTSCTMVIQSNITKPSNNLIDNNVDQVVLPQAEGANASQVLSGLIFEDKNTALQHGIKGIVILNLDKDTPNKVVILSGEEKKVYLTAKFVSYDPEVQETYLKLDPKDPNTLVTETSLGYGKGTITLNDLVTFDSPSIKLKSGEQVKITMTIKIPVNTPHVTIPLDPVGISSDFVIISKYAGEIDV